MAASRVLVRAAGVGAGSSSSRVLKSLQLLQLSSEHGSSFPSRSQKRRNKPKQKTHSESTQNPPRNLLQPISSSDKASLGERPSPLDFFSPAAKMADQTASESDELGDNVFDDISRAVNQKVTAKPDKKVIQLLLQFLKRKPSAHDRDTLSRYLSVTSDPPRQSMASILPLDELAQRLELIAKIEENVGHAVEVSAQSFALLLYSPLGRLRVLASVCKESVPILESQVPRLNKLLNICMSIPLDLALSRLFAYFYSSHQKTGVKPQFLDRCTSSHLREETQGNPRRRRAA